MAASVRIFGRCPQTFNQQLRLMGTRIRADSQTTRNMWPLGVISGAVIVGGGILLLKNKRNIFATQTSLKNSVVVNDGALANAAAQNTSQGQERSANLTRESAHKNKASFTIGQLAFAREQQTDKVDEFPLTAREVRFNSFASLRYDDQIYMTMQDFLESIVDENPRPRIGRFQLTKAQVDKMLANTPSRRRKTKHLFRDIMDRGILSYTEYLFLLCILTKPKAGYEIAFKMFDRDGNKRIDRREFLLMEEIFRKRAHDQSAVLGDESVSLLSKYLHVADSLWSTKELLIQETTLLRYFFGSRGNDTLDYDTFSSFMDNLQTEVLELEFHEYSKGMPTISEVEFAKVLFKYTYLDDDEREDYIEMVRERTQEEKGITFDQFKDFFQFVNHLDDFEIVLRMYSFADQPMSEDEFRRAVLVTTGLRLADHVVHTVFQIFDTDGDGKLMQREFMGVMKNRAHRGFREHLKNPVGWSGFKACVRNELKQSQ